MPESGLIQRRFLWMTAFPSPFVPEAEGAVPVNHGLCLRAMKEVTFGPAQIILSNPV